jgi:hypothetical protein
MSSLLLIGACGPESFETPPASIEGRWITTDDPRYADRAFEITDDFLYLLQGGDTFAVHTIREVEIIDEDLPRYTIEYRGDEGDLFTFRVYLSQEDGGTLFLANQMNMKWRRDPNADVPWGVLMDLNRSTPPRSGS